MSRQLCRVSIITLMLLSVISAADAATLNVTLVDLDGNPLVSPVPNAVNEVRIFAMSDETNLSISGSEILARVQAREQLGSGTDASDVVTITFTPPSSTIAVVILVRRFDQAQFTTAVPFLVGTASQITIAVPLATSYDAGNPCKRPCRRPCFFRRWRR
jgi:hypothetical protein